MWIKCKTIGKSDSNINVDKRKEIPLKMDKLGRTLVKETVFRVFSASLGSKYKPHIYVLAHMHTYSQTFWSNALVIKKKEHLT